ncbi:hypothetical protein ACHQM5_008508 [Ranunculus cassubicifolius]
MALRLVWQAQKKLAPSLGVRLLQNPTTHFTVPLRFHHTAGSSNGVIPTHACSRPAYLDLGKNSLVDRILRAAATENLHEFTFFFFFLVIWIGYCLWVWVIDPIQSVKGKVVIDAFRSIDPQTMLMGQEARQTTSNIGAGV